MGFLVSHTGLCILVCALCFSVINDVDAKVTSEGTVFIDGKSPIAKNDENFICATLDWWPPEKCDYGSCSWGRAGLLNLIRVGGTLEDKVTYQTEGTDPETCTPFAKNSSQLFGFTQGCLPLARWDELNSFFNKSGALIIFGLNELNGKSINRNHATGPWNPANAASLIRYTVKKGYDIYGWELGNELCGSGIGVGVAAYQYASDTIALHNLVHDIYKGVETKPLIIGPGGFFDAGWFRQYLAKTPGSLNAVSHHIYNLGAGKDEHLIDRILNPDVLDKGAGVFRNLQGVIKSSGTSAGAWVGESGGAYNSGRDKVSNAFVFSFWYLDQLGLSSKFDTQTYCRQALIGGNYGLLDTTTFYPNPDYYSALLWHRVMGKSVLSTNFTGTRMIRAYSHCAKQSQGVTLLLINLDGRTTVKVNLNFNGKQESGTTREEYHLTPMNGDIQSQTVLLNGKALMVEASGAIPDLKPFVASALNPIIVDPYSIVFVHLSDVAIPACKQAE